MRRFLLYIRLTAPYEAPENAEFTLKTGELALEESVAVCIDYLESKGYIAKA